MRARLDQHFLVDAAVADRIVAAADPRAGEAVLEIGPGRGILTQRLVDRGAKVTAVEIDESLLPPPGAELEWLRADFLEIDLARLPSPCKVVSNLPYSMASPILQRLLPWEGWTEATLMFQKEVAERVEAGPGSRAYGVLSVSVAAYADAARLFDVGRHSFRPAPKVESSVVRLLKRPPRLPEGLGPDEFFPVVKAAFAQRRKMAANSIASALGDRRERVQAALAACGIPPGARGETIDFDGFVKLALALRNADLGRMEKP